MRLLALLLAVLPFGLAQTKIVTVDDLKAALSNPRVFVIDVRTQEEFAQGHIKGAVNWPVQEIDRWWNRVPKDRVVYIHCNTQNRSGVAVRYLMGKGYQNLNLVHGGIQAWMAKGYPTTR
ncbi:rhodanese-like domain-containing protein [Meiothermus sp. CFH 77666]|uniref:rhodanese-like domain-containing protein n=1 Tax=Meiothermus sp. CFH 77666 TaxID=2817942 RepID=UPI001AA012C5|nr:rhodanese-like domain-containing protein [Meiothermus sp. CFH 77666]MBO1438652.1 rhodanese-like domain-containing protein [Meiothermus sp. CFH 77666]